MHGVGERDAVAAAFEGLDADASASRWVDVDGPVYYRDFGGPVDGPLIVCVHGLGASHTTWWSLAPLLARRGRVLALDLAGFGRTETAGRRADVRANQRLLAGFLAQVAGDRAVLLVGNSMGGLISVLQAAAEPRSVGGLVLISPAVPFRWLRPPDPVILGMFAGMSLPKVGGAILSHRRRVRTAEQIVEQAMLRTTADPRRVPADAFAAMVALTKERTARPGGPADSDAAMVAATRSIVGQLARRRHLAAAVDAVAAPTLLIHGARDRLVPVTSARHVARRRPDWRLEVLDDCAHLAHLEAPRRTAALIDDWLDSGAAPAVEAADGWETAGQAS